MRIFLRICLLAVLSLCLAAPAFAQSEPDESSDEGMRASEITDADSGTVVKRPDGWVAGKPGKGVIATLRPAGDSKAQIEVRVSAHVKDKQAEFFFTSFHSNLQKAGFSKKEVNEAAVYDDKEGIETEYETSTKSRDFNLIVWQHQYKDSAYLVVGFFPSKKRDLYYDDFKKVIEELSFKED